MINNKKAFLIYKSFYSPIKSLTDNQLGRLFRSIFEYQVNDVDCKEDDILMAFSFFKGQFDLDNEKYEKIVIRNKQNGSLGGRPKNDTPLEDQNADIIDKKCDFPERTQKTQWVLKEPKKPSGGQANPEKPMKIKIREEKIIEDKRRECKIREDKKKKEIKVVKKRKKKENDLKYFTSKGIDIFEVIHKRLKDSHSDAFFLKQIQRLGADRFYALMTEFELNKANINNPSAYFTESLKEFK